MKISKKTSLFSIIGILLFFAGYQARPWIRPFFRVTQGPAAYSLRTAENKYTFINPLLGCEVARESSGTEVTELKNKVMNIVESAKKDGVLTQTGIYYRDLNTGQWFGINHDLPFSPASLFKVPILIAYLRLSEIDPSILQKQVRLLKKSLPYQQQIVPGQQIQIGTWYTVSELLQDMIQYSDNNALEALLENINGEPFIREILSDLGLSLEQVTNADNPSVMTAKTSALLFRILRNGTYLTRDNSEKALQMLSETEYHDGLMKGIEKDIPVAHKFGERFSVSTKESEHELHDCGIIYYPDKPYLLCVMTQGADQKNLEGFIQSVSRGVYEFTDSQ